MGSVTSQPSESMAINALVVFLLMIFSLLEIARDVVNGFSKEGFYVTAQYEC